MRWSFTSLWTYRNIKASYQEWLGEYKGKHLGVRTPFSCCLLLSIRHLSDSDLSRCSLLSLFLYPLCRLSAVGNRTSSKTISHTQSVCLVGQITSLSGWFMWGRAVVLVPRARGTLKLFSDSETVFYSTLCYGSDNLGTTPNSLGINELRIELHDMSFPLEPKSLVSL